MTYFLLSLRKYLYIWAILLNNYLKIKMFQTTIHILLIIERNINHENYFPESGKNYKFKR